MTPAMVTAAFEATGSKIEPKDIARFRKGDFVVYPAHGVGKIDKVGFEQVAGARLNLIHISFDDHQMTLRVPVSHARAAGLRELASRKEMADALVRLKGRPRVSRLIWSKCAQEYLAKINSGELGAIAEVVRDLQTTGDGSGRSFSQHNLFELALDRLAGEFAAVNRITKAEAVEHLNWVLLEAKANASETEHRPTGISA